MITLSKLLKRGFLKEFLADAAGMLGSGCFLAVVDTTNSTKLIFTTGAPPACVDVADPASFLKPLPQDEIQTFPLAVSSQTLGYFFFSDPTKTPKENAGKFLARSLQEIVHREYISRSLADETLEQYRDVALLQRAIVNLNSSMKLQDVVDSLLEECKSGASPTEFAMVLVQGGNDGEYLIYETLESENGLKAENLPNSQLFQDILNKEKGEIVNDLESDPRWNNEMAGISSLLITPLRGSRMGMGALAIAETDPNESFQAANLKKMSTLASVAGIAMANAYHFEQVQQILLALIKAMATAIDSRDRMTAGHSSRVVQLAVGLAKAASEDKTLLPDVDFDDTQLQEIFYAGLLHDVGKIGVREEVLTKATRLPQPHLEIIGLRLALWGELTEKDTAWQDTYARLKIINKAYDVNDDDEQVINSIANETVTVGDSSIPIISAEESERLLTPRGNLTPEEWEEIKRHPEESFRILKNIPFRAYFPNMLTMILQHHERMDGSGYPHGIQGEEVILQSRIMAIVDIYDALRQDRHYKKALSQQMALTILQKEAERNKLDTRLVELFCRDVEIIEKFIASGADLITGGKILQ